MSNRSLSTLRSSRVRAPPNSSVGFGGRVPAGRMLRPATSSKGLRASSRATLPMRTSVMPGLRLIPKISSTLGLRRSQSTRTTWSPCWAMVTDRLAAVTVLPSPAMALPTTRDRMPSWPEP